MADDRFEFPLTPRHFSATFLDFQRNSRGYEEEIDSADLDAAKRLLSPFLPNVEVPQCHPFGNVMWTFAKECMVTRCPSRSQSTGYKNPPKYRLSSEEDLIVTPSEIDELSRPLLLPHLASIVKDQPDLKVTRSNTIGFHKASNIKVTSNGRNQNQNTVVSEFSSSQNEGCHLSDCLAQKSSCEEVCEVHRKLTSAEAISNSDGNIRSYFENHVEPGNCESGTKLNMSWHSTCPKSSFESNAGIGVGIESKLNDMLYDDDDDDDDDDDECKKNKNEMKTEESVASMPYANDVEGHNIPKGHHLCDGLIDKTQKSLKESFYKGHPITPFPLYKQRNYNSLPVSISLTVNLNLDVLLSVRSKQKNAKNSEHSIGGGICGKLAILYGFQQNSTLSVVQSEVVGLYDYILGTVSGLQEGFDQEESESQDMKSPFSSSAVALDLTAFLAQYHHTVRALSPEATNIGKILKEHSPVAWLLTSPALGVTVDWQVQEKLVKFLETLSANKSSMEPVSSVSSNLSNDSVSARWYNLLVVMDEYRYLEKDVPLVEVYELCTSGEIKLVNFDLNL